MDQAQLSPRLGTDLKDTPEFGTWNLELGTWNLEFDSRNCQCRQTDFSTTTA